MQVKLGALPTKNMPRKSHETPKPPARRPLVRADLPPSSSSSTASSPSYKDFAHFEKAVKPLKLNGWTVTKNDDNIHFKSFEPSYASPAVEVIVNHDLGYNVLAFGWALPIDSPIYSTHGRSMKNITIGAFLSHVKTFTICSGITRQDNLSYISAAVEHPVPHQVNTSSLLGGGLAKMSKFYRAQDCSILVNSAGICDNCSRLEKKEQKEMTRKEKVLNTPAHKFAPLTKTNPQRVVLALKEERSQHKDEVARMQAEIDSKGIELKQDLNDDFYSIMEGKKEDVTPFMQLFWEEQKRLAKGSKHAIRYHPMIIRFCISLASKSSSAYDELRSTGVLTLPSRRTLRDYTNYIKPSAGFNKKVIEELIKQTAEFKGAERFVCLAFDEIKIEENLVFDKSTGDLVGFVDLGGAELNYSTFENTQMLASHVMVFFVRCLIKNFKFSLAYFGTTGMSATQIMLTFWEAVSILEVKCRLPVICTVCDGASSNRKFFKIHKFLDDNITEVVHRSVNLFATDYRFIYFFSNAPHLMKTARNCLQHSGETSKSTRLLWNNGDTLIWSHLWKLVNDDMNRETP